ncbi:hypothetical protein Hypma_008516 [Hypsizygus marmoreus]|uniref:Uncharacterized protein n=1 Tax=Hypsizygus marmoreus TaxID=39966 RepID=A0A369JXW5_HYPMA|nr:hypothetical protein Hypma_008516 [Hypsizygus marmoreus]
MSFTDLLNSEDGYPATSYVFGATTFSENAAQISFDTPTGTSTYGYLCEGLIGSQSVNYASFLPQAVPSSNTPTRDFGRQLVNQSNEGTSSMSSSSSFRFSSTSTSQQQSPSPLFTPSSDFENLDPAKLRWDHNGNGGNLRVHCPRCRKWVGTGSSRKRNLGTLKNHMGGVKCRNHNPLHIDHDEEVRRAQDMRTRLFPPLSDAGPHLPCPSETWPALGSPSTDNFFMSTPADFASHEFANMDSSDIEMDIETFSDTNDPPHADAQTTRASSHDHVDSSSAELECPGLHLDWAVGTFWDSYPFHRHGFMYGLGYMFSAVEEDGSRFWICANNCERTSMPDGMACPNCQATKKDVDRLSTLARHAEPHTNHKYLNHEQLRMLLEDKDKSLNEWKLKALSLGRKCVSFLRKLGDHSRFLMAISTGDIPRLNQLVKQGLKDGAGISAIIRKVESALAGAYHARGYGETDLDIALMVLRLGGRRLLYALNHKFSVPSLRALRRARVMTRLMPSIGSPKTADILFNIRALFNPKLEGLNKDRPFRTGMSVFWDEINMEEVACYFPHLDSVGGLCREHSDAVNVRLATFGNAEAIAHALADGTVHYGKEASVIAMGSFGTEIRGAFPIFISPTCKHETPQQSAGLLEKVISAWKEAGAMYFGPIWSFASDGNAGRRAMMHSLFVKHPIAAGHKLFKFLGRLLGLNLFVGDGDITGDIDWKHEIKRVGRLLRTLQGVTIGRTIINPETLRQHLQRDKTKSDAAIDLLLRPEDSQDVPRAIDFIEAVHAIALIPPDPANPLNPTQLQEVGMISAIGEMFTSFLHPFIRPTWDLTAQVTSLSKYAHMSFALFREFRVNFMPHQLYGDIQTTVKNIIFCIAKQQELDGDQPFYLFFTGDDRLEVSFGVTRMQGGHNPNFTFKQLLDRLAAAFDLYAVFARNPELDPGHRRLKVTRTEHSDHLNPESWPGMVHANSVDLASAWREGCLQALKALRKINITPDFDALFDSDRVLDMLKPFGDGKYPGISKDTDRSLEPISSTQSTVLAESTTSPGDVSDERDLNSNVVVFGDASDSAMNSDDEPIPIPFQCSAAVMDEGVNSLLNDIPDIEESLEQENPEDDLPLDASVICPSPWIQHEGKQIHKTSICRLVITPDYIRKSHERPLRVRGFTSGDHKPRNYEADNVIDTEAFIVGDLFSMLIRCDNVVALAILKCIGIEEKGVNVGRVKEQALSHAAGGIKLTGQVLDMRMVRENEPDASLDVASHAESPSSPTSATSPSPRWLWNGSFARLDLDQANPSPVSKAARKTIAVKVASTMCESINPRIAAIQGRLGLDDSSELDPHGTTWEMDQGILSILLTQLWDNVRKCHGLMSLPRFRTNATFPYRSISRSSLALISEEGCRELEALKVPQNGNKFRCYQCLSEVDSKRAHQHVGEHVLRAIHGALENLAGEAINPRAMPCGFCGRSGIAACSEIYLSKGKAPQAQGNCEHAHRFNYAPSLKSTASTPCTNVPILCLIPGVRHQSTITRLLFGSITWTDTSACSILVTLQMVLKMEHHSLNLNFPAWSSHERKEAGFLEAS